MELSRLMTRSMREKPWGMQAARIMHAALEAADPELAILNSVKLSGDILKIGDNSYDLSMFSRILVVGAGKAGQPMAAGIQKIFGSQPVTGYVIVKEGYANQFGMPGQVEIIEAGHPIPDRRGNAGAERITHLLAETKPDDLVFCLLSGGGSALLVSPVQGISLEDLQNLTDALLAAGATINEINTLRKHLETLKGGGIARLAPPASLVSLILSDVIGDPLDVIASGPTVPDPTTYADALAILDRYDLRARMPTSITGHLNQGESGLIEDTPKPGDPVFENVTNTIIGSNRIVSLAALKQAGAEGFHSTILSNFMQGEASQVGISLGAILHQISEYGMPLPRPACIIIGGETTVTLQGSGYGGRNQELALGSVEEISGLKDVLLITLATDGGDGPTDAAGAVVTGETYKFAQALNLEPHQFLRSNDAYNFFYPLDDLIFTGPTQTNVNDLTFLFAF